MDDSKLEWELDKCEHLAQDEWIDVRRTAYKLPDGSIFEPFYSYSRRDFVVIAARDTEGRYICVRQFRHGLRQVTTEFCAGGIEAKDDDSNRLETALHAAKRELKEETGYESEHWRHLLTIPANATLADNYAYLFAADDCVRCSDQKLDDTEFLEVTLRSEEELQNDIDSGNFQQVIHVLASVLAKENQAK